MPMDEDAVASLRELGLSLYEARLTVGLLAHGPQNGNELSRTSGVPSSKVYATLDRLAAAGIVQQRRRGNSSEYASVPAAELVARLRAKYARPLERLERVLPTLGEARPADDVLRIVGAETIVDHARALAGRARAELYVSVWDETIDALRDALVAAEERGVRVFAMVYGEAELAVGLVLHHSYRETVASRIGGRMLTLVADGREALVAHVPERGEASGVVTASPVLCLIAEEYLRHDLILQKAKTMTGFAEWDAWLHADGDVRAIMLGRTGRESPIAPRLEVPAAAIDTALPR